MRPSVSTLRPHLELINNFFNPVIIVGGCYDFHQKTFIGIIVLYGTANAVSKRKVFLRAKSFPSI